MIGSMKENSTQYFFLPCDYVLQFIKRLFSVISMISHFPLDGVFQSLNSGKGRKSVHDNLKAFFLIKYTKTIH